MSASTPLNTSHLIAEQTKSSTGQRAAWSAAVTSAMALDGALVMRGKLFLGAVFFDGELHRTLDGELDDAGLLVAPCVGDGLRGLFLAELGQHFLASRRRGFPVERAVLRQVLRLLVLRRGRGRVI